MLRGRQMRELWTRGFIASAPFLSTSSTNGSTTLGRPLSRRWEGDTENLFGVPYSNIGKSRSADRNSFSLLFRLAAKFYCVFGVSRS